MAILLTYAALSHALVSQTEVTKILTAKGYSNINIRFKHGYWKAKADKDGMYYKIYVADDTGTIVRVKHDG